jgi:phenylalanine-4-hydroxylase
VPEHLLPFLSEQDPSLYTPIDQAAWRYIQRASRPFFEAHAHPAWLPGLQATGVPADRIPLISEMDACLAQIGFGAVPVVGFIPPAVFMELLSLGLLPIACDMRRLEHLGYTPAPDIVHEAAGHAPILAEPAYGAYVRRYGELARRVIFSRQDEAVYEAVRDLSDREEDPATGAAELAAAREWLRLAVVSEAVAGPPSEAQELSRMAWWTIEYGLVGDLRAPRIYGAGLLSSVSEAARCLGPDVERRPLTLGCIEVGYDITRPQPQLFVAPDFAALGAVLEQLAERMAYRRGGLFGLERARTAGTVTTTVLDSGLQISGVLAEVRCDGGGRPRWLRWEGPAALAAGESELEGFGTATFPEGLSIDFGRPLEVRLASLPGHLACGSLVVSVFGGAADRARWARSMPLPVGTREVRRPKTNLTEQNRRLCTLYARVRSLRDREHQGRGAPHLDALRSVHAALAQEPQRDWLLRLELLELAERTDVHSPERNLFGATVRAELREIAGEVGGPAELIQRGLEVYGARL